MDTVDPKLQEQAFVEKDAMQAIHVAFLCLQPHANLRPSNVKDGGNVDIQIDMVRTPMKPVFLDRRPEKDDDDHSWEAI